MGRASSPLSKETSPNSSELSECTVCDGCSYRKWHYLRKAAAAPSRHRRAAGVDERLPRIKRQAHFRRGSIGGSTHQGAHLPAANGVWREAPIRVNITGNASADEGPALPLPWTCRIFSAERRELRQK